MDARILCLDLQEYNTLVGGGYLTGRLESLELQAKYRADPQQGLCGYTEGTWWAQG